MKIGKIKQKIQINRKLFNINMKCLIIICKGKILVIVIIIKDKTPLTMIRIVGQNIQYFIRINNFNKIIHNIIQPKAIKVLHIPHQKKSEPF